MKFLLSILLLVAAPAFAEAFVWERYVLDGWKVIASATGDLNRDGQNDYVLVLEENNPANLKPNNGRWPNVINLNPRRLVVLFKSADGYHEVLRRDGFLPSEHAEGLPYLQDPLIKDGVRIKRGSVWIMLREWQNHGSYDITDIQFKFRYESSTRRFRLIGYDRSESLYRYDKQIDYSINYRTEKKKVTKTLYSLPDDIPPKTSWKAISVKQKYYLDNMSIHCGMTKEAGWCR